MRGDSGQQVLLRDAGVSVEQIRKGDIAGTPLFEALRLAERFGQDPFAFMERMRAAPRADVDTLSWYGAIRAVQEIGQ